MCISPSYSKSTLWESRIARASRVTRPECVSAFPNCELEHNANLGSIPKRLVWRAAAIIVFAICCAEGSIFTCVSAINKGPWSKITNDNAPTGVKSWLAKTCFMYFKCQWYCPKVPQIILSASPRCTITAAIAVVFVLMIAFAKSGVILFRAIISW